MKFFLEHGLCCGIGESTTISQVDSLELTGAIALHSMQPPTQVCFNPSCCKQLHANATMFHDHELVEEMPYPVTVFTRQFGSVPGYTTSLYCHSELSLHSGMYHLLTLLHRLRYRISMNQINCEYICEYI